MQQSRYNVNIRTIFPGEKKKKSFSGLWEVGRFREILSTLYVQETVGTKGREEQAEETWVIVCWGVMKSITGLWLAYLLMGRYSGLQRVQKQDGISGLLHAFWARGPSSTHMWKIKFSSFKEVADDITFHLGKMRRRDSWASLGWMRSCLHFICIERLREEEGGMADVI